MRQILPLTSILTVLLFASLAVCDDWPRFRGPSLDGISRETDWSDLAGRDQPTKRWIQDVGTGVSGIVTSESMLYTIGNNDDTDSVQCLHCDSGKTVWSFTYDCPLDPNEFEGGPTSTPTVDGDSLYTLSRLGQVHCFEKLTGKLRWSVDAAEVNDIRVPAWGFAGSPLLVGDTVLLNVGEAGLALNKDSGEMIWKSADKDAGYSSMVPIQQQGKAAVVFGSARSYLCVEIDSGKERWRQRWLTTFGCNAADPIVAGESVFVSSGYNRGSALLRTADGDPKVVWKSKEMQNQLSTSILINGFVYGIHGDVDAGTQLRCLKLATGEVAWSEDSFQPSAIAAAGDRLIVITNEGQLVIAKATSKEYEGLSLHPIIDGKCWTSPTLSDGLLYVRSIDGELTCLDLRTSSQN
ncbi:PQQ-binding-like beta-propeller repeat protein [Planctomycetes bacterium K23_9]|uniref:Outer membrane biogenesis protein BamB n=1 Tax=Stieleria marina TaxID=1930275 RepID=A0A517P060_9BACT|nr:outer membrane biogenesis protein BamB [Planctomycetes bacterium K23_9]